MFMFTSMMTHELDGVGPLHVSGHASIDEYAEMIEMLDQSSSYRSMDRTVPSSAISILPSKRVYPRANCVNAENGQVINLTANSIELSAEVPNGSILVDQTGAIVSNVVVKDRVLLSEEGLVAIVLTIDKKTGALLYQPRYNQPRLHIYERQRRNHEWSTRQS